MNIILALAATDMASYSSGQGAQGPPNTYRRAALHYSAKASSELDQQLTQFQPQNVASLYYTAALACTFQLAFPFDSLTVADRLLAAFEILTGAYNILSAHAQWLPYCSSRVMLHLDPASLDILDAETMAALNCLTSVSCQIHLSSKSATTGTTIATIKEEEENEEETRGKLASEVPTYRVAIAHMKHVFAEDQRGLVKASCFTMATAVGRPFFVDLRRLEPMAVFVALYFCVLLDRASREVGMWWIGSTGRELVDELSGILLQSPVGMLADGIEGICWARRQVGLQAVLQESAAGESKLFRTVTSGSEGVVNSR